MPGWNYTQHSRQTANPSMCVCVCDIKDPTVSHTFGSWIGQVCWLPWCPGSSWRRIPSFWSNSQSSSSMPSQPWNEIMTFHHNVIQCQSCFEKQRKQKYGSFSCHGGWLLFFFTANLSPWHHLNTLYRTICSSTLPTQPSQLWTFYCLLLTH